jgi:hypothetical protein
MSTLAPSAGLRTIALLGFLAALGPGRPLVAQDPAATPEPSQAQPAPAAGATASPESAPAAEGTATPEPKKLRPWQRQSPPPDGKWLVDEEGREYYVRKFKKPGEGGYLRKGPNTVRLPGGMDVDIVGEDAEFFFGKIYRVDNIETRVTRPKNDPTPEQLAAKEAEYQFSTPASAKLRFVPIGAGLPTSGQWRNGFDVADVNLDGKLDIVHGGTRRQLNSIPYIFLGDGKGGFAIWKEARYPQLPYDYGDVAVGDFNADKKPDLALGIHLRGLVALFGDGKGNFKLESQGLAFQGGQLTPGQVSQFSSRAIDVVDWNGDGRSEILALAEGPMGSFAAQKGLTNRMQQSYGMALYSYGAEGWKVLPGGKTHPELFGDKLISADFDGNGKPDFAAGSNSRGNAALVHLQNAEGTWEYVWLDLLRERSFARAVEAGDFDGDKRADLVIGYQSVELGVWRSGVDLLLSRDGGKFERRTVFVEPDNRGFYSLAVGDIDGDKRLDIAGGTGDGRVFVFLADGKGGFTSEDAVELGAEATCRVYDLALADVDRDKRAELIAAFAGEECPDGGRLTAWRAVPAGR